MKFVENGVNDLPMLMTQNHIRSTIYTEEEAAAKGLPTGNNINYHGLGKSLLMQSIDNMDAPSEIYKKSDDRYLIVTEMKDCKYRIHSPICTAIQPHSAAHIAPL